MTELEVVLITGTSRGIGQYLAEHFLGQNAIVEGCSRSQPAWSAKNYTHHLVDVTNEEQVRGMLGSIQKRHERLDIAINNAGIASMNHLLLTPADTVARIMDVNFLGTFLVCRESAKLMQRRHYGRIVNMGSVAVPLRLAGEAAYAAAKAAVVTFSQIVARELAEFGITCNVVSPSPIDTDLIRGVPTQKIDDVVSQLAIHRRGSYQDVANVIDFFVHPDSGYVTGQVIYLGGA